MTESLRRNSRWTSSLVLVCCLTLGGIVWMNSDKFLGWYYVHRLSQAGENEREVWSERIARLDRLPTKALVSCLMSESVRSCTNSEFCLTQLAARWGADDQRSIALVQQLDDDFPRLSVAGQRSALQLERVFGQLVRGTTAPIALVRAAAATLLQAARVDDVEVRALALELAASRLGRAKIPEMIAACRELARAGLRDDAVNNRALAVRLALLPGIDLRDQIVGLLRDPAPEIRRLAMLEVGPVPDLVSTDELLPWLHDPDADMRKLCEAVLRGRGLQQDHIKIGRLMTDAKATVRLQVLDHLCSHGELEPGIWLRRLSHDQAPAVRAATLRMSVTENLVNLSDRIEEMAQNDPSPTVRQLARFYLSCRESE